MGEESTTFVESVNRRRQLGRSGASNRPESRFILPSQQAAIQAILVVHEARTYPESFGGFRRINNTYVIVRRRTYLYLHLLYTQKLEI